MNDPRLEEDFELHLFDFECPVCGVMHEAHREGWPCSDCIEKTGPLFVIHDATYQLAECTIIDNEHNYELQNGDMVPASELEWIGKPLVKHTVKTCDLVDISGLFSEFLCNYVSRRVGLKDSAKAAFAEFIEDVFPF